MKLIDSMQQASDIAVTMCSVQNPSSHALICPLPGHSCAAQGVLDVAGASPRRRFFQVCEEGGEWRDGGWGWDRGKRGRKGRRDGGRGDDPVLQCSALLHSHCV